MYIDEEKKNLFFNILNDTDDEDDSEIDKNNKSGICLEKCLISSQPLTDNHITLHCNHKFNYESLLDAIIIQKTGYNSLNTTVLATGQIQCPYCRNIQYGILPFIPTNKHSNRIRGVTAPNILCMPHMKCTWCIQSGSKKGSLCGADAYKGPLGVFCSTHHKKMEKKEKFLSWNSEMEEMKKLTIPQIKEILHKNKLKKTGNKTTLIQRAVTFKKTDTT